MSRKSGLRVLVVNGVGGLAPPASIGTPVVASVTFLVLLRKLYL